MKVEMTSFDIAALIPELNQRIKGARIENIYQIDRSTIVLRLHKTNQPTTQLLIEAGKRIHLTKYTLSKPSKPPAFCMALRKYLRRARVREIKQHEFERAISIRVDSKEDTFELVSELFGDGNVILVNSSNKIIQALTYREMLDRNIIRGETFKHAPSSGRYPQRLDRLGFEEIKRFGQMEIVRALTKFLSIGGLYAEEILLRAEVRKNTPCERLTKKQIDRIFAQLESILSPITSGKLEPSIVVDQKGNWVDVVPLRLAKYVGLNRKTYKSFNEAVDEYYTHTATLQKVFKVQEKLEREFSKHERMLRNQERMLNNFRKSIEQNKRIGDLIYEHLGELQLLAGEILKAKQDGRTWRQIISKIEDAKESKNVPYIYYHSLDSKHRILNVSIEETTFSLDLTRSIQSNATLYYQRVKKLKRKLEGAEKAVIKTRSRIELLQKRQMQEVEEARKEKPSRRRQKAWYEKFHWFHSSEGFLVVGGRDASTNEILVKKHMEPDDRVLHADVVGAPFVLIKTAGVEPSEQTLHEAAQFAASHSKAWREMLGAINVYWVRPEQISKSSPPRQYLKKGAFMIRGTKNYLRNVPLRIAIGLIIRGERITVIGGPVGAVSKHTNLFVEVVPGQRTSSALAKQIRLLLANRAPLDLREMIHHVPIEDIQAFIPAGKGSVAHSNL